MSFAVRAAFVLILAWVALRVVTRLREPSGVARAYTAEMRVALRGVAAAQGRVRASTGSYTSDLTVLGGALEESWSAATVTIDRADSVSWRATARSDLVTQTCRMEGSYANGRDDATPPVCDKRLKFTPLRDSVRAGLAPRRKFSQWMRER